jgi:hypothetical protein
MADFYALGQIKSRAFTLLFGFSIDRLPGKCLSVGHEKNIARL